MLRGGPCDPSRMTRGQDDWLYLSYMTFSFHCFLPVIWRFYPPDEARWRLPPGYGPERAYFLDVRAFSGVCCHLAEVGEAPVLGRIS